MPRPLHVAPMASLVREDCGERTVGLPLAAENSQLADSASSLAAAGIGRNTPLLPLEFIGEDVRRPCARAHGQMRMRAGDLRFPCEERASGVPNENPATSVGSGDLDDQEGAPDKFAHSRSSLGGICGNFNSLCCHGPIGELLDKYETVFRNVPHGSLGNTKRPVTAAFTRWPLTLTTLVLAAIILYDSAYDMRSIVQGSRQAEC